VRLSAFFVVLVALLPLPGRATDDCSLNTELAELKARRGTTLAGPLSTEELDRKFGSYEEWLKIKAWMMPSDEIYHVVFREGRFRMIYYAVVREGCVRRRLLESIT
jgi:hypothetical protein